MISLNTEDWQVWEHAYGPATDIPQLLARIAADPRPKSDYEAEPWFTLWSSLCHQGDVYTASYAAIPHIVRICLAAEGRVDLGFFQLPACIEIARATRRGPKLPSQLSQAYRFALNELHQCAFKHAAEDWDEGMAMCIAAALAAAKGQTRVAEAIINLDDDIIDRINAGDW